jgi:hypothetical protein
MKEKISDDRRKELLINAYRRLYYPWRKPIFPE